MIGGVKVIMGRSKHMPKEVARALSGTPSASASSLARHVRKRVQRQGKNAQGIKHKYRTSRRSWDNYGVSPRYPARSGGVVGKSGGVFFRDSASFHAKQSVKAGSFSTSGGMWRGVTVQDYRNRARVVFRGRSEGGPLQGLHKNATAAGGPYIRKDAKGRMVAKAAKVSNALKAFSVFGSTGCNVLALTVPEVQSISLACNAAIALTAPLALGQRLEFMKRVAPSDRLARQILVGIMGARGIR